MENVINNNQTQVICNAETPNAVVQWFGVGEFILGEDSTHREKGGNEDKFVCRKNSGKEIKVRIDFGSITYPAELQAELFKERIEMKDQIVKFYTEDVPRIVTAFIGIAQQLRAAEVDFKFTEEPSEAPAEDEFDETR